MTPAVRSFVRERVPGLAAKVLAQVRPCVNAESARRPDRAIPVGHSKLGGRPDVPDGFEWPARRGVPCWFLAQIDLAALRRPAAPLPSRAASAVRRPVRRPTARPLDAGFRLPRAGLLSFFYHDDGGPPGPGSRVYYFPPAGLRRAEIVVDTRYAGIHTEHLFPRTLTLTQGYCLPYDIRRYGLTRRERAAWEDPADPRGDELFRPGRDEYEDFGYFCEVFHNHFAPATHRLFGRPAYEQLRPPPRRHQLLASFGEMNDRLNFYAPREGVEALEFGGLKVVYECT
ncbi:MAG TPA: DUF1963 domain-containing protein [Gemmataceae bacterium]|nr:DUF1963 domain-containing protein [Gemmataceae bacterium]